ncbi:MAG: sensor histidine kinase [Janthinobacterium lividum]
MSDLPFAERAHLEAQIQRLRAELASLQTAHHQQAQQQAEEARLYRSQLRFYTVFEHSPLGHKIIDAELIIRQANPAVAQLLGLESPLDLVGHTILEFVHPDYYDEWARLQRELWAHYTPAFTLETCLLRPDGTMRWCRVTSVLFPDDGHELGFTTLEDITKRKQLEAQITQHTGEIQYTNEQLASLYEELQVTNEELLEANRKLGSVNAELDTFVYAASHDLRTPISNLQGLVLALVRALPPDPQQATLVQPILGMMTDAMNRFGDTLDRLTDFTVVHTPEGSMREFVELAGIVEEVRHEVEPLLVATHGQLVVDLAGRASCWFAAKHLHSVILNLVSNAIKYRHPDRAPVVHLRSHREPGHLVVSVQDNGLGLSEQQQRQLFRLFKRLHSHVQGSGVGLYLVKKIIDHAGGSVKVKSEEGVGSTFTVVLPL